MESAVVSSLENAWVCESSGTGRFPFLLLLMWVLTKRGAYGWDIHGFSGFNMSLLQAFTMQVWMLVFDSLKRLLWFWWMLDSQVLSTKSMLRVILWHWGHQERITMSRASQPGSTVTRAPGKVLEECCWHRQKLWQQPSWPVHSMDSQMIHIWSFQSLSLS